MTREETKKRFQSWCQEYIGNNASDEDYQMFNNIMALLEQEPKTGHWIDDGFYAEGHSHKAFHCSKCGHNVLGFKEDLSNYCPNCGAKMEGSKR